MAEFLLQERGTSYAEIWGDPRSRYTPLYALAPSTDISTIRKLIETYADQTSWPWWQHFRIITTDLEPVERWKVRPGRAVRLRRRY